MTIGIALNVDAKQVRDAKRELGFLNDQLRQTENLGGNLELGDENLERSSDLLRKLGEDVRKLRSLASSGDRQGGLLRPEQFALAEKYSKKIRENFSSLSGDIGKAMEELRRLTGERDRLTKIGASGKYESPEAFMARSGKLQDLQAQIAERETYLAKMEKHRLKANQYGRLGGEASDAIAGFGTMSSGGLSLKKALAVGGALLGGMSILQFVNDAMAKEFAFGTTEADLARRGGTGMRSGMASYGFTPMEHIGMAGALNSRGLVGSELQAALEGSKAFARGRGISGDAAAEYGGGVFALSETKLTQHFEKLRDAVIKSGAGPRIEEYLKVNQELLRHVVMASGSVATGRQLDYITGLQAALWSMGKSGQGELGAGLMTRLDQGIRSGGGSPGKDLFWLSALGGDKVSNYDEYYDFLSRRNKGLKDPENLSRVFDLAKRTFGVDSSGELTKFGRGNLMSLLDITPDQADLLSKMGAKGLFSESTIKEFLSASGSVSGDAGAAMGLGGNGYRQTAANVEALKTEIGAAMLPAVNVIKDGMTEAARLFIGGLKTNPIETLIAGTLLVGGVSGGIAGGGISAGTGAVAGGAAATALRYGSTIAKTGLRASPLMALFGDLLFPSSAGVTNEEELIKQYGNKSPVDDFAEKVGRSVAEAMKENRGNVQRVEVVNPGQGGSARGTGK